MIGPNLLQWPITVSNGVALALPLEYHCTKSEVYPLNGGEGMSAYKYKSIVTSIPVKEQLDEIKEQIEQQCRHTVTMNTVIMMLISAYKEEYC